VERADQRTYARGRNGGIRKELAAGVNSNDVRFRREADMHERVVSTFSVANDPKRS
jgi:hypothetical protein